MIDNQFTPVCPVCPACHGMEIETIRLVYDDRYGYLGTFPLIKCLHCGHGFLQGKFTADLLHSLYSHYYPRSSFNEENYQPYREVSGFNAWLDGAKSSAFRWVPKNVRILDIGCGFGESLGYHQARGCEVFGVEADENILRVADKYEFNVHVGLFDPNLYEDNYFDYVTMSQVIEHVTDPVQTIQGIARILKPGGLAILSTPNASGWGAKVFGKYWINWHAPYHLQFFTRQSMKLCAEQAGLMMEKTCTITPSAWLHYQWIHLITHPLEGSPSVFWSSDAKRTLLQKVSIKLFVLLHFSKFNHLATRFFDALEIGDSQLYFIRKPF
jgi:2-polyprenyl-3-methyl-5-hydroxy-6-metoxy-1,4-benzoquinol methylase